jgi:hypothetical protein
MKKNYLLITALIITINLSAQITLTSSTSSPQVGDLFNYVLTPSFTFDVTQSGANQTWDFSSATGTSSAFSYLNLSGSSDPLSYPSANLVESASGAENYYSSSSLGLTLEGNYLAGVTRVIYNDKREFIKFPITYNDVFNETFSGTVENIASGQTFNRSGTIEIKADGYGDLILPYTTVSNVLRVKVIYNYSDEFMGFQISSYTDTICTWYNTTNNNFIANTSVAYINGSLLISQATHIEQSDLVTGLNNSNLSYNKRLVYPNPAKDYISFDNLSSENILINIYDVRGVLVKYINVNTHKNKVNVSDLNSGVYIIKYAEGSNYYTEKLIVE